MLFQDLITRAESLLDQCRKRGLKITTAESCTGGLIAALFTEVPGSSDVFERGFVTYSNEAKHELLNVPLNILEEFGAVSRQTAEAMATGALAASRADVSLSVTGIAGPGGGTTEKPVGLVHIGSYSDRHGLIQRKCLFGEISRQDIRRQSCAAAFDLLNEQIRT